jgi:hypothetical protein
MQKFSEKYGTEFYREAQMALEKIQVEGLVSAKLREISLQSQQEIATKIAERQIAEIDRNREIWIEYAKNAREAIGQVRDLLNALKPHEDATMGKNASPRYASGKSAGIDTQAAWLSPQEMVMNPTASRRFYSQLVAMNSKARRFSSGDTNYTFGDMNFNGISSNTEMNVIRIGKGLKKQIRLGRLALGH